MSANVTSLGDMVFGLLLLSFFAHLSPAGYCLSLLATLLIGALFVALALVFQSLAFFLDGGDRLASQLFDTMLCLGTIPQHTESMVVKIAMFTVLPAGFMAIMPVEIVQRESFALLAGLAGAVMVYLSLAVAFFHFGLKRYKSATGWQV